MTYTDYFASLKNKNIAVVGIGISNTPLIKMLVKSGAKVTACDKKDKAALGNLAQELEQMGVVLQLGEDYLEGLDQELVFRSPGIRDDLPCFLRLKEKGSTITSEMEVFFDLCPAQIIAVTGSDGKTTTTTLIYQMLKQEGYTCHLGGNIGNPLLPEIANIKADHKVVLELSSFQLMTMKKSPQVAVITNLAPNHLDWHKSMDEYIEAKTNLFSHQQPSGRLVTNLDNPITSKISKEAKGEVLYFSRMEKTDLYLENDAVWFRGEEVVKTADILLPGIHNVENYMAAIGAVWGMVSKESIQTVAKTFSKIPHRIEFVRELDGVKYYNDSIATSPTRAIAGLNSFDRQVIMIAGGYDKKIPFDVLGDIIVKKVKKLVLLGVTAEKIRKVVMESELYRDGYPEIVMCKSLSEALNQAKKGAKSGDVVILCPACASFDMYRNFEERGNEFKRLVSNL